MGGVVRGLEGGVEETIRGTEVMGGTDVPVLEKLLEADLQLL